MCELRAIFLVTVQQVNLVRLVGNRKWLLYLVIELSSGGWCSVCYYKSELHSHQQKFCRNVETVVCITKRTYFLRNELLIFVFIYMTIECVKLWKLYSVCLKLK